MVRGASPASPSHLRSYISAPDMESNSTAPNVVRIFRKSGGPLQVKGRCRSTYRAPKHFAEPRANLYARRLPCRVATRTPSLDFQRDSDSALDSVISTHRAGRTDARTLASSAESATIVQAGKDHGFAEECCGRARNEQCQ